MGEDIAWGMTPVVDGDYNGYMATKNTKYVDMMVDWADSLIKRAVKEPDGYVGWPSEKAAGTDVDNLDNYNADSLLSDAMVFTPIVLLAGEMTRGSGAQGEVPRQGRKLPRARRKALREMGEARRVARNQRRRNDLRGPPVRDGQGQPEVDRF